MRPIVANSPILSAPPEARRARLPHRNQSRNGTQRESATRLSTGRVAFGRGCNDAARMLIWAITSCVLGGLGVIGGALGAHALAKVLTPERLEAYQTAILYLMLHAIALLAVSLYGLAVNRTLSWAPRLWVVGIALFSGSIVLLTTTPLRGFGWVTPIGGVSLIAGWTMLAVELARS